MDQYEIYTQGREVCSEDELKSKPLAMNSMSVVVCGWEEGLWERGGVDVCGGYGRKWAMRDNEVGKREWDLSLRTDWFLWLAELLPRWVKYCEDKCYKTDVPLMFLFSLPAHLPFWVLSHYEEAQGPQLYGYPVLGFPTPRIMSLSNSPCLWMIHSQVFCYGTEKRLRSLPTSPFIRNPHRTSSDCSKWVPRVS